MCVKTPRLHCLLDFTSCPPGVLIWPLDGFAWEHGQIPVRVLVWRKCFKTLNLDGVGRACTSLRTLTRSVESHHNLLQNPEDRSQGNPRQVSFLGPVPNVLAVLSRFGVLRQLARTFSVISGSTQGHCALEGPSSRRRASTLPNFLQYNW